MLIASTTASLSVALGLPQAVRVPAVLSVLCLAPGTALLVRVRAACEPGLVVGVSIATAVVAAQTMLWLQAWEPRAALFGLCVVCAVAVAPERRALRATRRRAVGPRLWLKRTGLRTRNVPRVVVCHATLICAALLLWGASLSDAHLDRIGGLGLVQAMPSSYFVAIGLGLAGFAAASSRDELRPAVLGCYVLALIIVLDASTPILYNEPRYAWVYKHLGVINLIASTGRADRSIDIYNNWPSFFAANAWLSKTSGLQPIAYAAWAQLLFNIANVLAVRFALRGLTRDERLLWTAALFFVLGNWVGQDYLAPQALGFVLSLLIIGLCLRCGPAAVTRPPAPFRSWRHGLERVVSVLATQPAADPADSPLGPRSALAAGGVCFLAVVTSHQLSPVLLILSVACLRLCHGPAARQSYVAWVTWRHARSPGLDGEPRLTWQRRLRPDRRAFPGAWLPAGMAAIEGLWVALSWPFLSRHFSLIDAGSGGVSSSGPSPRTALPGAGLTFYAPAAVMSALAALALVGLIRRLRMGKLDTVPICLIGAPVVAVMFQSYDGEGAFRAYLFALPWLAFLAAFSCVRSPPREACARMSFGRLIVTLPVIASALLLSAFGRELVNRIPSDDVAASTWYEYHAPPGSLRIELAPNTPDRLTARYPLVSLADPPALLTQPGFAGHKLGAGDVRRLEQIINRYPGHTAYVVLSQGQENYARLAGLLPRGAVGSFVRALEQSTAFRLVYSRPSAWVFAFAPKGTDPAS